MAHREEEYTDYSCSTSLERLARDVETILRAWHVDRYSDRHVSIASTAAGSSNESVATTEGTTVSTISQQGAAAASSSLIRSNAIAWNVTTTDSHGQRVHVTVDLELALWDAPEAFVANGAPAAASPLHADGHGSIIEVEHDDSNAHEHEHEHAHADVQSDADEEAEAQAEANAEGNQGQVENSGSNDSNSETNGDEASHTNTNGKSNGNSNSNRHSNRHTNGNSKSNGKNNGKHHKQSHNPTTTKTTKSRPTGGAFSNGKHGKHRHQADTDGSLVKSLQRTSFGPMPWHNCLFDNFSSLFGIGQHISLSPIHPQPISPVLVDAVGNPVLRRHEGEHTAPIVFGSILSSWLQNSLNIAVSNCQCCIPAFGVWGRYRPNNLSASAHSSTLSMAGLSSASMAPTLATILSPNASPQNASHQSRSKLHASSSYRHSHDTMSVVSTSSSVMAANIAEQIGASGGSMHIFPQWTQAIHQTNLPNVSRKYKTRAHSKWNKRFCPPLISGTVIGPPTTNTMPSTMSTFSCCATTAEHTIGDHGDVRLTTWARVLLRHCPSDERHVVLCGARHVFRWIKQDHPMRLSSIFTARMDEQAIAEAQQWRLGSNQHKYEQPNAMPAEATVERYREECRHVAVLLLESAWKGINARSMYHSTSHDYTPIWGPEVDPVGRVYATSTWNGKINPDGIVEPLLSLPYKVRSQNEFDRAEMEDSVEKTILNPLSATAFCVQSFFDRNISMTPLTASQRCTVAALIRSATLPGETLIQHLIDEDLVDRWDNNAGTVVAMRLADRMHVNQSTKQIVRAMDWSNAIDEMIEMHEAESIVHDIMSEFSPAQFPNAPEESFLDNDDVAFHAAFRKSAPWGRLLSILFAHMARLRSISSIAMVWDVFVNELRRRWEMRESIPNMRYNSGLDPHPLTLYERRCYSTIGHKANFSAFLHCVEPDPDDFHCLIGQKLQVLNLGVECIVASEIAEHEAMERFLGTGEVAMRDAQLEKQRHEELQRKDMAQHVEKQRQEEEQRIAQEAEAQRVEEQRKREEEERKKQKEAQKEQQGERAGTVVRMKSLAIGSGPIADATDIIMTASDDLDSPRALQNADQQQAAASKPASKWPKAKQQQQQQQQQQRKKQDEKPDNGVKPDDQNDYGPPTINTDLEFWVMDEPGHAANLDVGLDFVEPPTISGDFDFAAPPPTNLDELQISATSFTTNLESPPPRPKATTAPENKFVVENLPNDASAWEGTIMHDNDGENDGDDDSNHSMATSATLSQMYYDAAEAGSIFSMRNEFVSLDAVVNMEDMQKRPGARCPVYGANLGSADEQLYAPYLQRPFPLTDDVVLERKLMLARKLEKGKNVLQCRLELAQRLQRPKLVSDMRAFKAANPKAKFQDFIDWYGNPGNPLDDYSDTAVLPGLSVAVARRQSTAKKMHRANEARRILNATRDFWMDSWAQAEPLPAVEQKPLFDVTSTVEMALDYMEQMHPTNLLNQIVCVNLSSAYFAVVSSAQDALEVDCVKVCLSKLRKRIDRALTVLSRDAAGGSTGLWLEASNEMMSSSQRYASDEAILACDEACDTLAEAETMVARAVSLLHKFPREYKLVQALLTSADGTSIVLQEEQQRKLVLKAMPDDPVMREYVMRNLDDGNPCQLSVRYGEITEGSSENGLVLAIAKSWKE